MFHTLYFEKKNVVHKKKVHLQNLKCDTCNTEASTLTTFIFVLLEFDYTY